MRLYVCLRVRARMCVCVCVCMRTRLCLVEQILIIGLVTDRICA